VEEGKEKENISRL